MMQPISLGSSSRSRRRVAVLLGGICFVAVLPLSGIAHAEPQNARQWAILIGIEKYEHANPLQFTINDVDQLSGTLQQRNGVAKDHVLKMVDTADDSGCRPTKANLTAKLPEWLAKPGPDDQVMVYFSGHGFRDKDGKLYLAPIDCDPADPASTGIAVVWLREQIAVCKAALKLLVLDACHAGSEKGDDDSTGITAGELGEPFRDMAGVVTIASSTAEEKSQIWGAMQQSLFSFWLNQAFKGHADRDGDGKITIDELYNYVHRNVTGTAKLHFARPQTPVRIVRSGTPGVPVVAQVRPQSLKQLLADVAEQLAVDVQVGKFPKVGVLEFTTDTPLGEALGGDFGLLGRYCAVELERQLVGRAGDKFTVVDRRRLQSALKAQEFGLKDLGSPDAMERLAKNAGGMPVVAVGTLRDRAGRVVTLQCQLIRTRGDELAGAAGGTALLNESEWAMLGRSAALKPGDYRPEPPMEGQRVEPISTQVIKRLDQRAKDPNPLLDPNFPFRLKVLVNGVERPGVPRGNDLLIPLRKGETYRLEVANLADYPVFMRLLVDGLNTLPEKLAAKGVAVEAVDQPTAYLPGQRVNLAEARAWRLDPRPPDQPAKVYQVPGFFAKTGAGGTYNEFVVVDAQDSLAARQQFTDQIGLITAAFYSINVGARSIGTGAGAQYDLNTDEYQETPVGNLLGVVHLRYVEPEAIPQ